MTLTPTSLYAKLFIHGFSKPSYASVTARVAGALDDAILRRAGHDMAARYPLLGSVVQWAGPIPIAFRALPIEVAFPRGYQTIDLGDVGDLALDLPARFVAQLAEPPPPDATLCRFWHVRGTFEGRPASALALQVHHAIVDADSAKVFIGGFLDCYRARAQGLAPALPPRPPARPWLGPGGRLADAARWLRTARLSAGRVPDTSLVADRRFDGPIERAPIEVTTLALATAERQAIRDAVRRRGLTFGQAACAALMRACARYNAARAEAPPERVGLMVAVSPRRADETVAAAEDFGADSRTLELPHALLADPGRRGELLDAVRAAIHRGKEGHNGVLLGLFYASRLVRPPRRAGPRHVRRAHVVFSDFSGSVTSFLEAPFGGRHPGELALASLDVAVSPVALDQVNVLCARYLDTTTFRVIAHAGVVDGPALTALLAEELRELAHA
ncbi:MAG: hypothetical protein IT385_10310 [Deltaproteobacteria bacterium]|nr:hypothetical protein [Deltaproteobacteria bacterium]